MRVASVSDVARVDGNEPSLADYGYGMNGRSIILGDKFQSSRQRYKNLEVTLPVRIH